MSRQPARIFELIKTRERHDLDTIVIPAREEGFQSVFMRQHCWWPAPKIRSDLSKKIRYIAVYRAAPVSAITHYALSSPLSVFPAQTSASSGFLSPKRSDH